MTEDKKNMLLDKRKMLSQMLLGQAMQTPQQGGGYLGALNSILAGGLAGYGLSGNDKKGKNQMLAQVLAGR